MAAQDKNIAYFSAEFGVDSNTPTYAGGLGILAGDTLKEAADRDYPMTGVGLLYRGQYFIQRIDESGWQQEEISLYDPASACLRQVTKNGVPLYIKPILAGQEVHIKAYQIRVGDETTLYLLSSDSHYNPQEWRDIMAENYWGDPEVQFRQQLVLGVGGVMLLEALGIKPDIYHLNEGRPSLLIWELLKKYSQDEIKRKIVYTNHTLLRSGNLHYNADLVRKYADSFADEIGVTTEELIEPGKIPNTNDFGITEYALSFANKINSVSTPHKKLSEEQYPEYKWVNITNGVHIPSWQNTHFRDPNLSSGQIWDIHNMRKKELANMVLRRSGIGYDPSRLVISWARRMAAYKRLDVLFEDIERLKNIMSNIDRPIQLLVAGKAHPGDEAAKAHIQQTIQAFAGELSGHAIFVPNYDIALSRQLVAGSDIWLNTPQMGSEACGTSGMKAISNGVINMTIPDGWAAEVDWEGTGWTIDSDNMSSSIYELLDTKVAPLYYKRNHDGLPEEWIEMMKKSIQLSKKYSTVRMFDDYIKLLYS